MPESLVHFLERSHDSDIVMYLARCFDVRWSSHAGGLLGDMGGEEMGAGEAPGAPLASPKNRKIMRWQMNQPEAYNTTNSCWTTLECCNQIDTIIHTR